MPLPIKQFYSINEGEKDSLYYDKMIEFIRWNMVPLVSEGAARVAMDYLYGLQNMSAIENQYTDISQLNIQNKPVSNALGLTDKYGKKVGDKFDPEAGRKPEMRGVDFKSLPVLVKALNIVLAEMKKMGPITNVRANDPTSVAARKHDEALIKNRKEIEGFLSYIYTQIGQPPVKMSQHQARFGDKPDKGNTADFDKMGFDPDDPDDVGFFMDVFHKLDEEIEMEKVIHAMEGFNEIETDKIPKWTVDAIAKNAVAGMIYVSDDNGAPILEYLSPETVYIYGATGRREDYNDAMAKGYQQNITVKQLLDRVGDAFDWEKDVNDLMMAIFFASNGSVDITGINPDYRGGYGGNGTGTGDWFCKGRGMNENFSHDSFMNFKVVFGYLEWSGQDYTEYGKSVKGKSFDNKKQQDPNGAATDDNQPPNGKRYQAKARYECPTYKSFYLALTSKTHKKYECGKVSYQQIKGYNDFNSNFSIKTWKGPGDPLAVLAIPMINTINTAYYKFLWIIIKSKAPGMAYNMESLEKVAEIMFVDTDGRENRMTKMIQHMDASSNYYWAFPDLDGRTIGTPAPQLHVEIQNGVKKEAMIYWDIVTTQWDKLIDMLLGNSDLRQGDSPANRASTSNEFKSLEYSQNSTAFIPDMITFMCREAAVCTGMIVQDIIQFKDYDTLAYKFLLDIVGQECLDKIEEMGKVSMYRYGITVESLNQSAQRQKNANRIDFALQGGAVTLAQVLLIENIKSPNLAARTLAYFESRNTKVKQKQIMQQQQQQQQGQIQIEQLKQQTEKLKSYTAIAVAQIQADAQKQSHIIAAQKQITTTAMKHDSEVQLQQLEAKADSDLANQSANIDATGKQTVSPQPPVPQSPQGPPPQADQQSAVQGNLASSPQAQTSFQQ